MSSSETMTDLPCVSCPVITRCTFTVPHPVGEGWWCWRREGEKSVVGFLPIVLGHIVSGT
jgi:hypothetical protein